MNFQRNTLHLISHENTPTSYTRITSGHNGSLRRRDNCNSYHFLIMNTEEKYNAWFDDDGYIADLVIITEQFVVYPMVKKSINYFVKTSAGKN